MTDDEAMRAAAGDDPAAFALIFDRHFAAVHAYLDRRLGRDAADDRAAEVFRIAFESRARFRPEGDGARPWLFGIATNLVARHRRSEGRRLRALARLGGQAPTTGDAYERSTDALSAAADARRVVGRIPLHRDGQAEDVPGADANSFAWWARIRASALAGRTGMLERDLTLNCPAETRQPTAW